MTLFTQAKSAFRRFRLGARDRGWVHVAAAAALLLPATLGAEPLRLQLKWYHQFQFAGYYAAEAQGYYAAEGLDVSIVEGGVNRPPIGRVLAGAAEFGVGDAEVLLARLKGAPIVTCAAIFQHSPYVLMSRADRLIRTPSDLVGARVMLSDDQGAAQVRAMMTREGIDPGQVTVLPQSWNIRDLVDGRIDAMSAYATVEPARLRALGVEPALLRAVDYGIDFYGDTLFTTEDRVRRHPEQVEAFRRASLKGWAYALAHAEEMAGAIAAMPGVAERGVTREMLVQEARAMVSFILPDIVEIGHMNPERWRRIGQVFVETGLAPDLERFDGFAYDPRPESDSGLLRWLAGLTLTAAVVALVGLLWNVQMRRSVRERTAELNAEAARRRQAESELRSSEERLRRIFEAAVTGITVTAADGRFVYANPAYCAVMGYTQEELRATSVASLTHPDDRESSQRARERLLSREAGSITFEKRSLRRDGATVWAKLSISLLAPAEGGAPQFVAVTEDITERKRAEALLLGQKRVLESISAGAVLEETLDGLLRLVEEQAPDVSSSILLVDPDGGQLRHVAAHLSERFTRAIDGIEIAEGSGSCGTAAFRGEPVIVEDIASDPLCNDYRELAAAEGLRACWSTPVFDAHRKVVATFALYLRQPGRPTDSHRALLEMATQAAAIAITRHREEHELRESRKRLMSIYDTVGDSIFLLAVEADGGFRFESVNRQYLNTTGLPLEQVVGRRVQDAVPADSLPLVLDRYRQAVAQRTLLRWQETSDYPAGRLTGEVSVAPILDDQGRCTHLVGAVHDVTARKLAEAAHAHTEEMLRQSQKLESIGRLAGGVAHDFNNILGVILGYGELMRAQIGDEHRARPRLDHIIQAARRAADLTRQLLAFSRKQVMQPRPVNLNELVAEMRDMLERVVGEDIEFAVSLEDRLGAVRADPSQVQQVVMNLVVNARDAMPDGGLLTIETANADFDEAYTSSHPPAVAGRFAMLAISDSGTGMDAETLDRIFEPFFTTKPAGEGTGLGLATVYGIVKQMGGYVWAYSEVGQGTSFKVYLPQVAERATALTPEPEAALLPRGHETLLVVEDNENLRGLVHELLTAQGYRVLTAPDAEQALAVITTGPHEVDLVLTDVVMPKLGGRDLGTRLKALRPQIPVIYMSGYTSGAISRQGVLAPEAILIEKPFTSDKLARTIRMVLDRKRSG